MSTIVPNSFARADHIHAIPSPISLAQLQSVCTFKIGQIIEWTNCVAVIRDIHFLANTHVPDYAQNICYKIEWVYIPDPHPGEILKDEFFENAIQWYSIKLANEQAQILYGKT